MKSGKRKVWLISGSRTPIGSFGKSLKLLTVDKLAGHTMVHAMRRAGITGNQVDGVFLGHGFQSGFTPNTARCAWLDQGLPANVPAATVQRQCGSGMEAVHQAANEIRLGNANVMLAGGAESMSTVPYIISGDKRWSDWADFVEKRLKIPRMGPLPLAFTMADNGIAPRNLLKDMKTVNMSGTAQRLADQFSISRDAADDFSLESQAKAKKAIESGRFDLEIDPIQVPGAGFVGKDEHPRNTSKEKLGKLKGVLGNRDVTAGNASGINDGACSLILASDEKVAELGVEPLAEIVDTAVAGVEPETMGLGPVEAIKTLLERNNLTLADIDLIEVNEAFAAQYLACEKILGLDRSKVNVNGGAIALGHPIGMSGARLILTLAHELKLRGKKRGIAALCIGGGQGIATLIERP